MTPAFRRALLALALAAPAKAVPPLSLQSVYDAAISRRVARDASGRIYLLRITAGKDGRRAIALSAGPSDARALEEFSEAGEAAAGIPAAGPVLSAGMVIDRRDRLNLVWTEDDGSSRYARWDLAAPAGRRGWTDPVTGSPGSLILAKDSSRVGDIAVGPEGEAWVAWVAAGAAHRTEIRLGSVRGGAWRSQRMAAGYGFAPPTLALDGQGRFLLAWHDIFDDCRLLTAPVATLGASVPASLPIPNKTGPRAQGDGGYRPVAASASGQTLLVRENWQNRLQYGLPDRDPSRLMPVTGDDPRFAWDTVDTPQISLDRYGIPWLFFIDGSRQTAFCTRWLGTAWGPFATAGKIAWNTPRMEDSHLPLDRLSVESAEKAGAIAVLLENDSLRPAAFFRRVAVPGLAASPGNKVLFLDLDELASLDGLTLALNQPRKAGEVIGDGSPGDPDADHMGPPIRVLRENGLYRMWYAGAAKADDSDHWWEWYHALYAESADGRTFHRVKLGLVPYRDRRDTNLMPGLVLAHAVTGICSDPLDPDPEARYKFLRFSNSETFSDDARAGRIDPWTDRIAGQLLTSGDGLRWKSSPATLDFPAGRPLMGFIPQCLLVDRSDPDPAKRYKAYGFSALDKPRRCGFYATSRDGRHWTASAQNPILDPLAAATPPVHGGTVNQIHDTIVWREGPYYLALYQLQHDGVFLDLRLAVSRDGENFTFVRPEKPFLSPGRAGEWDSDQINPSAPVFDSAETKFYYGAVHFAGGVESTEVKTSGGLGLAVIRPEGYTDLELSPGRDAGSFATIPIDPAGASRLLLNADCGSGGIEVEVDDAATGRPAPGYAQADCVRVGGNSLAKPVAWRSHPDLGGVRGPFRLRFHFLGREGGPKLYSFSFR